MHKPPKKIEYNAIQTKDHVNLLNSILTYNYKREPIKEEPIKKQEPNKE